MKKSWPLFLLAAMAAAMAFGDTPADGRRLARAREFHVTPCAVGCAPHVVTFYYRPATADPRSPALTFEEGPFDTLELAEAHADARFAQGRIVVPVEDPEQPPVYFVPLQATFRPVL